MITVDATDEFKLWLRNLRDRTARARINKRLRRIVDGNFGDAKPVGGGVSEIRINFGPGYRVDFTQRGPVLVILLCGGDKSTQNADIEDQTTGPRPWSATMTTKTSPFDPAEFLDDDHAIAEYITASLEEDTPAEMARALGDVARARGMTQIARDTGLSRESLYKALSGDGNPRLDTVLRVMKALRLKLSVSASSAETV